MLTVGSYGGNEPCGSGHKGVRDYWAESFSGRFLAMYEEGYAGGLQDAGNGAALNLTRLRAVEVASRDDAWDAKHDGYRDAVYKTEGPID